MKKYKILVTILAIVLTLSACGNRRHTNETKPESTIPETQTPTTMPAPTLPSVKPNIPQETESRGSTDDTNDDKNESLPDEIKRIRRRIIGQAEGK